MKIFSERVYVADGCRPAVVEVEGEKIVRVEEARRCPVDAEDFGSLRVIPGIFDTHNHGTLGYDLMATSEGPEARRAEVRGYLKGLASQGTTSVFPTVSDPAGIRAAAEAKAPPFDRPNVRLADLCRLAFADAFDATLFKPDGVHPNEAGSIRVAQAWRPAFDEALRALEAAPPAIVHLHNGVPGQVRVRLNRPATAFAGATLALGGGPTLMGGAPDPRDPRVLVFPCATPFRNGNVASATLTHGATRLKAAPDAIELLGSGAEANVPEAFRRGFVRLQALDLNKPAAAPTAPLGGSIRRVAYYLELKRPGQPPQFVWVSMDAAPFGNDPARADLPVLGDRPIKAEVGNLSVFGNRGNFAKSVRGGRGLVEITPLGYAADDDPADVAEATPGAFGWNDALREDGAGYGCLQVARIREDAAGTPADPAAEMLLAYHGFRSVRDADAGIGSFVTHRDNLGRQIDAVHDWTFFARLTGYAAYAPAAYERRLLEIWAEPLLPSAP